MSLSTFSLLTLFSFFFTLTLHNTTSAINNNNLIHETCTKCSKQDPNLTYNFCITSLQAAKNINHCKTLRQLGFVSVKLIRHNVTATKRSIKRLLKKKEWDPYTKSCLDDCLELYSEAVPTLEQAQRDYRAKRYDDANIEVSSVMDASTTCEDEFYEKEGVVSVLTKRNNDTFQLTAIALSIINMLV